MRVAWSTLVVIVVAAMCASCVGETSDRAGAPTHPSPSVTGATATAPSATETIGDARACNRTSPTLSGFPEVEGIGHDATIYGLLFFTHPGPVRAGEELKIVWRMTGEGDLSVSYFAPNGRPGVLTFGPEAHSGSSYDRPGEEWGTGFSFDSPGCWQIHLERSVGSGDVWLPVAPA